jgi:hypothetical protein
MIRYLTRRRSKSPWGVSSGGTGGGNLNGENAFTVIFARTVDNGNASTLVFSTTYNGGTA